MERNIKCSNWEARTRNSERRGGSEGVAQGKKSTTENRRREKIRQLSCGRGLFGDAISKTEVGSLK